VIVFVAAPARGASKRKVRVKTRRRARRTAEIQALAVIG